MNPHFGSAVLLGCCTQQMCITAHKLPLQKNMLQTVSKITNTVFDVMLDTYQQFGATCFLEMKKMIHNVVKKGLGIGAMY
jgi:hypothetical protein